MPPSAGESADGVRQAEIVAALSLAVDLGVGQPLQQGLRCCLLATRLAEAFGCGRDDLRVTYYVALLRHVGCTAENDLFAGVFGDEIALRRAAALEDYTNPVAMMPVMLRHIWSTRPAPVAARAVARLAIQGRTLMTANASVCEAAQLLAGRLGLGPAVRGALSRVQGRWSGRAMPGQPTGEALPLPVRIVQVAESAEIFFRLGRMEAATGVVRDRAGGAYDPAVAAVFCSQAADLLEPLRADSVWDDVLAAEPGPSRDLRDDELDAALHAVADFTDLKSRYTVGHSSGVARLAAAAATCLGLPATQATTVRRAGLVHDLGRVGISAGVWGKPRPLSAAEWEDVRLHPYYLERALSRPLPLARLAGLAALHHERLDGSGYHRGAPAVMLPAPARILAAADVFHALTESRPHRPALSPAQADDRLRDEARGGKLDPEAVEAVRQAAGRPRRRRRDWVAGLTTREAEVLRHVARGESTRRIASSLTVSPKTVDAHIQHIYVKIGVSTRAGATLFAMEHGLVDSLDAHPKDRENS